MYKLTVSDTFSPKEEKKSSAFHLGFDGQLFVRSESRIGGGKSPCSGMRKRVRFYTCPT